MTLYRLNWILRRTIDTSDVNSNSERFWLGPLPLQRPYVSRRRRLNRGAIVVRTSPANRTRSFVLAWARGHSLNIQPGFRTAFFFVGMSHRGPAPRCDICKLALIPARCCRESVADRSNLVRNHVSGGRYTCGKAFFFFNRPPSTVLTPLLPTWALRHVPRSRTFVSRPSPTSWRTFTLHETYVTHRIRRV